VGSRGLLRVHGCFCFALPCPEKDFDKLYIFWRTDVVKVSEMAKLEPGLTEGIQPYVINQAKVLFLKMRPQPRPPKGSGSISHCRHCARNLQVRHTPLPTFPCALTATRAAPGALCLALWRFNIATSVEQFELLVRNGCLAAGFLPSFQLPELSRKNPLLDAHFGARCRGRWTGIL
jgi:PLATZ transcription factor